MKKTTIASLAFLAVSIALTANTYATTPPVPSADTATFTKEPSTWAPEWDGSSSPYSRNIFWDFSKNPSAPSPGGKGSKDATYFGINDTTELKDNDSVATTSKVIWNSSSKALGIFQNDRHGVAMFNIANLVSTGVKHFWLEMDINIKKTASYISADMLTAGGSVVDSWGTYDTLIWSGTDTGLANTVNAWFKINPFSTAESLQLTFHSEGSGSYAYVDNVHIATTPEPISAALFLTGAAVMAFRRRRNLRAVAA